MIFNSMLVVSGTDGGIEWPTAKPEVFGGLTVSAAVGYAPFSGGTIGGQLTYSMSGGVAVNRGQFFISHGLTKVRFGPNTLAMDQQFSLDPDAFYCLFVHHTSGPHEVGLMKWANGQWNTAATGQLSTSDDTMWYEIY